MSNMSVWPPQRTRELVELYQAGQDYVSMAAALGTTKDAIARKLQRLRNGGALAVRKTVSTSGEGCARTDRWSQDEINRAITMRNDLGCSDHEIAAALGRSHKLISYIIDREMTRRAGARHDLPSERLIDRDNRLRASESQSLTAATFGDPPPGYSALARREQRR